MHNYIKIAFVYLLASSFLHAEALTSRGFAPLRIVSISATDNGSLDLDAKTFSLDVVQDICNEGEDDEVAEPFFDSLLVISVLNETNSLARIKKISYVVQGATNNNRSIKSMRTSPIGNFEIYSNQAKDIFSLFLDADSGRKYFSGTSSPIDQSIGFKNVIVIIRGEISGRRFVIRARTAFSFDNFDRCED